MSTFVSQLTSPFKRMTLSDDRRHYLLSVIKNYTASNQPVFQIFDHLHRHDENYAIREIAKVSKYSIRERLPFASGWEETGYFTDAEQRLLCVGEEYDCLPEVCDFFTEETEREQNVIFSAIARNIEWVIMIGFSLVMSVYGLPYAKHFDESEPPFFFVMGEFILNWGWYVLAIVSLISIFYAWSIKNVTGATRTTMKTFGMFKFHDKYLELKVLRICGALSSSNMPPIAIVEALLTSFATERQLVIKLKAARKALSEIRLDEALPMFITSSSILHIRSKAPDATSKQFSVGFKLAAIMLHADIEQRFKTAHFFAQVFFVALALATTLPLLTVVMGMGLGS